ncbi:hypothetical protein DQ384_17345 [Sphaerisporangium album]|uniref:Ppx/GppA phosphatase N-terminal domain-containing protein n=1 Tax=Sphaerisporangium album TaxID=509200 RepID=A0A367FJQ9_9ACTN|nr:hypothetical protein [Sphaerisporangium album]RCG30129.1 hypothetical protein DQ384_17345 [Sphaerisporangium album]
MRHAGVLDVGCHSALLTVVRRPAADTRLDTGLDTGLETVTSRKVRLRLNEMLGPDGRVTERGVRSLQRAVAEAMRTEHGTRVPEGAEVFAFATSVIRDAPNRDEVIARIAKATGTRLRVLSGQEEARLAYVAARQWAGPPTGRLLVLDIGGGTVEVASGFGAHPETVHSLPLGARTVTRQWLPGGVARSAAHLREVRRRLRHAFAEVADLPSVVPGGRVLACSKTFTQLARLGAAHAGPPATRRRLTTRALRASLALLARTDPGDRGRLPGISAHRAEQSLAGALVAEALMHACGATRVEICPWSTREGLLLERLAALHRLTPARSSPSPTG